MKTLFHKNCAIILAVAVIFFVTETHAQIEKSYSPLLTHSEMSKDLIEGLESQFEEENKNMPANREIRQINYDRRSLFMEKVLDGAFIKDEVLEKYVTNVLNNIVKNNHLQTYPRRVLILSSAHVNAVCYGQGIYAVTVGLLGRIENENQLAFILAHELAHDELGHIRTRIVQEADLDLEHRAREQTIKIISGKVITKDIEEFRRLIYDYSKHSRENEMRADSMAIVLLRNALYSEHQAYAALGILQSAQSPKYPIGAELFLPLHAQRYPFQDYWLNDRLSVYSKKYMGTFLYAADSIETHPSIPMRKAVLESYLPKIAVENTDPLSLNFINQVSDVAAFETVESAYKHKEYDLALYHALQLFNRYPSHSFLVSRIGKILSDLYEMKGTARFDSYVAKYTPNYCDELKLINSFLHNLTQQELGEVAFHFLAKSSNFNAQEKAHHYLLWKVSSLTNREAIIIKTSEQFRTKFGSNIAAYKW